MKKTTLIIIALIILIAGALVWRFAFHGPSEDQRETSAKGQVACSQDVRECSDGSFVHRVAPSCTFEKCPDDTQATASTPLFEDGTVQSTSATATASTSLR